MRPTSTPPSRFQVCHWDEKKEPDYHAWGWAGLPFDRHGIRWAPITFEVQSEMAEIEANFPCSKNPQGSLAGVRVREYREASALVADRKGSLQHIFCFPFDKGGRVVPKTYYDFVSAMSDIMKALQPDLDFKEWQIEEERPSCKRILFTFTGYLDPSKEIRLSQTNAKVTLKNGCFLQAIATQKAFYMLVDKRYSGGKIPEDIRTFFDSFKIY